MSAPAATVYDRNRSVGSAGPSRPVSIPAPDPNGVAVADMGQLPTTASGADLTAAWSQIGDELAATIGDPSCLDVKIPTPMGPTPYRDMVDALPEDVLIHTWTSPEPSVPMKPSTDLWSSTSTST
jgi:hypothetical protein